MYGVARAARLGAERRLRTPAPARQLDRDRAANDHSPGHGSFHPARHVAAVQFLQPQREATVREGESKPKHWASSEIVIEDGTAAGVKPNGPVCACVDPTWPRKMRDHSRLAGATCGDSNQCHSPGPAADDAAGPIGVGAIRRSVRPKNLRLVPDVEAPGS